MAGLSPPELGRPMKLGAQRKADRETLPLESASGLHLIISNEVYTLN